MRRWDPATKLFIISTASVILLMLFSDSAPHDISSFAEIESPGESIRIKCLLISISNASRGWICVFEDTEGMLMRGFCSEAPPPPGSFIEVLADASSDKEFIYIKELRVLRSAPDENINIY